MPKNNVVLFFVMQKGKRQMTTADLTEQVNQVIEIPMKESDVVVSAIFDGIVRALQSGKEVEIRGFGSFHTRQRRRIGRNPRTGAQVEVPPKRIPVFKPSRQLRELVDRLDHQGVKESPL
jgi:integration host factor subunit beta